MGLTRKVVCDLGVVASRLEALQRGERGRTKPGTCRGFWAQIRPDSSAAAEEELRREIRWALITRKACTSLDCQKADWKPKGTVPIENPLENAAIISVNQFCN